MQVSAHVFTLAVLLAGALLALWVVARFPKTGPSNPLISFLNVGVALVVGSMFMGRAPDFLRSLPLPDSVLVAIILGTLPPLVYLFTSLAWFVRSIQRLMMALR